MKSTAILVLTLALSQPSIAADPKELVTVNDSCGYCSHDRNFWKGCTIFADGTVEIEQSKIRNGLESESKQTFELDTETLEELQMLVRDSTQSPAKGEVQTGSGDLPSFEVKAYPENQSPVTIQLFSVGKRVLTSPSARQLARKSARICGMEKKRILWNTLLSKLMP